MGSVPEEDIPYNFKHLKVDIIQTMIFKVTYLLNNSIELCY